MLPVRTVTPAQRRAGALGLVAEAALYADLDRGSAGDRYQVLAGVAEGERIVASANFLVDAESRLGTTGPMPAMPGMPAGADTGRRP